jgi:hypothetical protein
LTASVSITDDSERIQSKQKLFAFCFFGNETYINKIFESSILHVAYKTKFSINKLLNLKLSIKKQKNSKLFTANLRCFCKKYKKQTGRNFDIDIFVNCNWVDTWWQDTFAHKQYIEHHD